MMYVFLFSDTSLVKHCLQPREGTQVPPAQVALGTQGALPGQATSGGLSTIWTGEIFGKLHSFNKFWQSS